jgi:hypothetical protein
MKNWLTERENEFVEFLKSNKIKIGLKILESMVLLN